MHHTVLVFHTCNDQHTNTGLPYVETQTRISALTAVNLTVQSLGLSKPTADDDDPGLGRFPVSRTKPRMEVETKANLIAERLQRRRVAGGAGGLAFDDLGAAQQAANKASSAAKRAYLRAKGTGHGGLGYGTSAGSGSGFGFGDGGYGGGGGSYGH
ncbi:glycine-rich RNA-binding protein 5, mitochondrial-like [Penaeus monodon]|uniref:glycine-rich RNA-binding protein 5, mitochondrial-like n=1 Tax=Penaeus monodon TaxID=6687 RepID=UPI0018A705F8|nr:glycine-rich RNA-binding protein 5, mitochondrial-like [Penaeus monodon]